MLLGAACGDSGSEPELIFELSDLSAPGPNQANVMLSGEGFGDGSDVNDVPAGRTDTYAVRLDDFGVMLPSVVYDNAAGLGHGYVLFELDVVTAAGTRSTSEAGVSFQWNSPGGQTFFPTGPCTIVITAPPAGTGSQYRGETACEVTSGGFTFTALVKFNRVVD
ncbi:MAG: hypothetical protein WD801_03510 [Gemmatimonadaceae bacterium]